MPTPKWVFPPHQAGYLTQDPVQRGFFTVDSIGGFHQALVREAIQNALDARKGSNAVRVRFGWITVAPDQYRHYFTDLLPHLQAVNGTITRLPDFTKPMQFFVVEDFNTTGLDGNPNADYIETSTERENFYYFWRNVGRTGKTEGSRGRWGLGKTVFPAISGFSTFFGLTRRASDGRRLLMGQAVLKHHSVGGIPYTPYGYFGTFDSEHTYLALPIEDTTQITEFASTFQLLRKNDSGLSLVIPLPASDEFTPSKVALAAIYQYFHSILTGDLELQIDQGGSGKITNLVRIDARNFEAVLRKLITYGVDLDIDTFSRMLDFARWAIALPSEDYIELSEPDRKYAPDWKKYLTQDQLARACERFETTGRIAFKVGMKSQINKNIQIGWFKVFIERDELLSRPESHFLRNGIRLVDVKGHPLRGIRGIVVIDDPILSRMLGDAENPAHTEWQKDTPMFRRYLHGQSSLSFVKNSLSYLSSKLVETNKTIERDLLRDIFFVEQPPEPENRTKSGKEPKKSKLNSGENDPTVPEISSSLRPVTSQKIAGGVAIYSTPESPEAVRRVTALFAYETRRGNPFQAYSPLDFDLTTEMGIEGEGIELQSAAENQLVFAVDETPFRVEITGFDGIRDIVVRLSWEATSV